MDWSNILPTALPTIAAVLGVVAWTFLCRTFPSLIGDAILRKLSHEHNVALERMKSESAKETGLEIERVRAELGAAYATIKNSVDFVSAARSGIQAHVIESADTLWQIILQIKEETSDVTFMHNILAVDELEDAFSGKQVISTVEALRKYANEKFFADKLSKLQGSDVERHRLFVGERLWLLFFLIRAIHFRLGLLVQQSFNRKAFRDWRRDTATMSLINSALPKYSIDPTKPRLDDLHNMVSKLDAEFLKEAARVMSGSHSFAESVSDIQSTLLLAAAQAQPTANR